MNTDNLLLKHAGDKAIENGDCSGIITEEVLNRVAAQGVSRHDFYESLAVLGERRYLKLEPTLAGDPSEPELRLLIGGGVSDFSITEYGFEHYAKAYIHDYTSIVKDVRTHIVNDDQRDSASIAEALDKQQVVVDHVFKHLEQQGLIQTAQFLGSQTISVTRVSAELRRIVREGK